LAVALSSAHLLNALLFKTSAADPLSACLTAVILLVIATLAVSLPARKAASVSPTEALRAE
jgi:ABC-type lipoprotein release transport system permease subunit